MSQVWRLVIEYGPRRADGSHEELGAVQLPACSEAVADEAALVLLRVFSKIARKQGWQYGVAVRMDSVLLGPRREQ